MRVGILPDSLDGEAPVPAKGRDFDTSAHEVLRAKDVSVHTSDHIDLHITDTNTEVLSTYRNSSMKLYNSESRS